MEDEDDVREPIPQKRETLIQAGYEGYSMRPSANVNRGRVRSVFDGFRNFGNEASEFRYLYVLIYRVCVTDLD